MTIFSYDNFRQYIRDHVDEMRLVNKNLSLREILRRVGCSSPSYYKEVVVDAKKKMSQTVARSFAAFFGLSSHETDYFLLLVQYNQSKLKSEKVDCYEKMLVLKKMPSSDDHVLDITEYGYMTEWQHVLLRELLPMAPDFGNRNEEERLALAKLLRVKLTAEQIDKAMTFLEEKKFIRKNRRGNYEKTEIAVRNDKKTPAAYKTLSQFIDLGKSAIGTADITSRLAKTVAIGINRETFLVIEKKINDTFQEIIDIAVAAKSDVDRLYAINIQFFPVTRLPENDT